MSGLNTFVADSTDGSVWHSLGKRIPHGMTGAEAMRHAELGKPVRLEQMTNPVNGELVPTYAVIRGESQYLEAVGKRYTPIQEEWLFDFGDAIIGVEGHAQYSTAGSLGHGERYFASIRINGETEPIEGDRHRWYLTLGGSHDASSSNWAGLSAVRVVCRNTLAAALSQAKNSGDIIRIRHTKSHEDKLAQARAIVTDGLAGIERTTAILRELAQKKVSREQFGAVMGKLFGKIDESKRAENRAAVIARLFDQNDGDKIPGIRGTQYALLQACTNYADHESEVRETSGRAGFSQSYLRADSAAFGSAAQFKRTAWDTIRQLSAETAPARQIVTVGRSRFASLER